MKKRNECRGGKKDDRCFLNQEVLIGLKDQQDAHRVPLSSWVFPQGQLPPESPSQNRTVLK